MGVEHSELYVRYITPHTPKSEGFLLWCKRLEWEMHHLWFVSVLKPEPGRTHAVWPTDTLRDVGCWLCGAVDHFLCIWS